MPLTRLLLPWRYSRYCKASMIVTAAHHWGTSFLIFWSVCIWHPSRQIDYPLAQPEEVPPSTSTSSDQATWSTQHPHPNYIHRYPLWTSWGYPSRKAQTISTIPSLFAFASLLTTTILINYVHSSLHTHTNWPPDRGVNFYRSSPCHRLQ